MLENYDYKIIGAIVNCKDKRALVVEGTDWGYSNPSYKGLPIIKETEHFFLCRIRGQGFRFSLGAFRYINPKYIIFKKNVVDGKNVVVKPLGEWELEYTKETMKQSKKTALEKIIELEKVK